MANLAGYVTAGVALSAEYDGDVTAGVTSMEECGERDVVPSDYVDDYDDYHYDCQYDDCPDYYDYDDSDDYGDYNGDVIVGVIFLEEYQERDVILSDAVLPQTNPYESSADPRPSLPCARTIMAADYPPAPFRDTADCSPADVAPVTYPDLAAHSPANFDPTTLRNSADPSPAVSPGILSLTVGFNCLGQIVFCT